MIEGQDKLIEALSAHPLFADLDREALVDVIQTSVEIHLDRDDLLYTSGSEADSVFVILRGALQIEYPGKDNTRGQVTTILKSPGFLGESQVINNLPWSGTGAAVTESLVLGIRKPRFIELTKNHPSVTRRLYFELAGRFLKAIETWRYQPSLKPAVTVARYLLALRTCLGSDELEVRQKDLARAAGMRPETANRLLKSWSKEGWVEVQSSGLRITDVAAVEQLAEASSASDLIQSVVVPSIDD